MTQMNTVRRELFVLTIFVGSFLLFMVQPMVARMALPQLGGAPAVWNSAMLVYQTLLLGGYAYAHWLGRFRFRHQAMIHAGLFLLAMAWLPVGLANLGQPASGMESLWVPLLLAASIGPIFFVVSAQAPLVQRWFAADGNGQDPYLLYAASNLGSFSGLFAYPLLFEPLLPVAQQRLGWSVGYVLLFVLVLAMVAARWRSADGGQAASTSTQAPVPTSAKPGAGRIFHWLMLAAVPSGLMLSTTTHLTTDIVAMPLMWAIPLGLYLLSFVVAFGNWPRTTDAITGIAPAVLLICGGLSLLSGGNAAFMIAMGSMLLLFVVAVALHGHLYALRPEQDRLTFFYLIMSAGGALGGLFAALIAPVLFDWVYEHPILVLAAAALLPLRPLLDWASWLKLPALRARYIVIGAVALTGIALMTQAGVWRATTIQMTLVAAALLVGLMVIPWRWAFMATTALLMFFVGGLDTVTTSLSGDRVRSYFGVYEVTDDQTNQRRNLTHGTTLHGVQRTDAGKTLEPTTYYARQSGIGLALTAAPDMLRADAHIGIVGLGTGTLACYRTPTQRWDFYEIDPVMVDIALDANRFTFMPECAPDGRILVGDARIEVTRQPPQQYDLLAIDAFSSDAIPLHLLTQQAFDSYARVLRRDGVLLVHISNRFFDLEPVLAAEAKGRGWSAAIRRYTPDDAAIKRGETGSVWGALAPDSARLAQLTDARDPVSGEPMWRTPEPMPGFRRWTDDHASVLPIMRWDWIMSR